MVIQSIPKTTSKTIKITIKTPIKMVPTINCPDCLVPMAPLH